MTVSRLLLQESLVTGSFDLQDILFYGGCGFSIMRCMSFGLENCEKKDGNYKFSDLLKYNFYLPFFFFGPVMTFDRYHAQVRWPAQQSLRLCWVQLQRITSTFHRLTGHSCPAKTGRCGTSPPRR